jgi:hypothetical protein
MVVVAVAVVFFSFECYSVLMRQHNSHMLLPAGEVELVLEEAYLAAVVGTVQHLVQYVGTRVVIV